MWSAFGSRRFINGVHLPGEARSESKDLFASWEEVEASGRLSVEPRAGGVSGQGGGGGLFRSGFVARCLYPRPGRRRGLGRKAARLCVCARACVCACVCVCLVVCLCWVLLYSDTVPCSLVEAEIHVLRRLNTIKHIKLDCLSAAEMSRGDR